MARPRRLAGTVIPLETLSWRPRIVAETVTPDIRVPPDIRERMTDRRRDTAGPSRSPSSDASTLVGRDAEMAVVRDVLATACAGFRSTVLVEGEAGIGKSRLVEEALSEMERGGSLVVRGWAREPERDRPFGAIGDALGLRPDSRDPERAALARLLHGDPDAPTAGSLSSQAPELRFRLVEGIVDLVERLAGAAPVALLLEDLHWADDATLLVVEQLARRLKGLPVVVLATLRPAPRGRALDRLVGILLATGATRLEVGGLDPPSATDLVAGLVGAVPGPGLRAQIERAGGNPLYLGELVEALVEEGGMAVTGETADVRAATLPTSLGETVVRRLRFLDDEALDVLSAASVLGTAFSLDDLAVMLDTPATRLLSALREPLRARLVAESGERLAFRHDLVRDALYADLPLTGRRALHLQAARLLAGAGRRPVDVARHFVLGAAQGDAEAIDWLSRAARDAAARSPEVAAQLLQAAVRLAGPDHPRRDVLEAELAAALVWSGSTLDGEARLRAILDRAHAPEIDVPVRLALAQALFHDGRGQAAVEEVERTMELPALEPLQRGRLLAEAALGRLWSGALDQARVHAGNALTAGHLAEDDAAVCSALAVQSWLRQAEGDTSGAIAIAERAVEVAESSRTREASRRPPQLLLGLLLIEGDQLDEAGKAFDAARRIGEDLGTVWDLPAFHWALGLSHFVAGDYDDALAEVEAGLDVSEEVGTRLQMVWAQAIEAHIRIQRDDLHAATAALEAGERELARAGPQAKTDWLLWARALLAEAQGDTEGAHAILRMVWDAYTALGVVSERRALGPDLVRLSLLRGARSEAEAVAGAVQEAAEMIATPGARGAALRCRGLASGDAGLLLDAVRAYRESPRRMELGHACEDAGVALARAGRRDQATALLAEAVDVYEASGARRPAKRAEAALRDLGVRRGKRGARRRPATGWAALTDSEQTAARLAAEGLTNRQIAGRLFVSPRTVETHLSHTFAKLGIGSRVELAATVARQSAGVS
jgi:DNA-binding CsgD family transcriptional regulator